MFIGSDPSLLAQAGARQQCFGCPKRENLHLHEPRGNYVNLMDLLPLESQKDHIASHLGILTMSRIQISQHWSVRHVLTYTFRILQATFQGACAGEVALNSRDCVKWSEVVWSGMCSKTVLVEHVELHELLLSLKQRNTWAGNQGSKNFGLPIQSSGQRLAAFNTCG